MIINTDSFTFRGETRTSEEFGKLIIASADDGKIFYRFLFTEDGQHAVNHPKVKELSKFFELDFMPARLDGEQCLVNTDKL